jgi:Tol biopolymer transport system component
MLPVEGGEVGAPAISPDGLRVAYSARRADGTPMVWVRTLDRSTPTPLAGTEEGVRVFWSPDSKRLGFIVGRVLKQISADGGPVREVVRNAQMGGAWGANDVIVYAGNSGEIFRVDASGGKPVAVTTLQGPDWEHVSPSMLPDGRLFLFTAKHWAGLADAGSQGIYLGSIDTPGVAHQVLPELSSAVYAPPGFLVFARDGQLMAAPFSLDAGRVTGEPIALGESVAIDATRYTAAVSADGSGTLAIRPPPAPVVSAAGASGGAFDGELTLLKRDGTGALRFGGVQLFTYLMAISPNERAVVAAVQDARSSASDLWHFDVASGSRTPLTSMRTSGGWAGSPIFSSSGTQMAYACQVPGMLDDVCVRDMKSGVVTKVVESKAIWEHPRDWSPDGLHMLIAYNEYLESSVRQLRVWSAKTRTLSPYVESSGEGVFSPDARFVAFTSVESGRDEVLVTTFPERRQTWPLTTEGGSVISWNTNGNEILVATLGGHIAAYPVSTSGGAFSAGPAQILIRNVGFDAQFARATRDHSRVLVRVPKDADKDRGEIRLLAGWAVGVGARRQP